MMMRWFRRNQKLLMAALVVMLMLAWGAIPTISSLVTRKSMPRGKIRGETVT